MRSRLQTQTGSVTAELAIATPAVLMVASLLISGIVLGVQRVQLAYDAGTLARAASRDEPITQLSRSLGVSTAIEHTEEFLCIRATVTTWLMPLTEKSCQRKLGL